MSISEPYSLYSEANTLELLPMSAKSMTRKPASCKEKTQNFYIIQSEIDFEIKNDIFVRYSRLRFGYAIPVKCKIPIDWPDVPA